IKDIEDNELAIIYNDQLKSKYELYDISRYPFGNSCAGNKQVLEILYKLPLKQFENDSDGFPVDGFDNIIIIKTLQLIAEGEENKEERAILINTKSNQMIKQKIEDKTGQVEQSINYPRRKILGMFSPYRNIGYS